MKPPLVSVLQAHTICVSLFVMNNYDKNWFLGITKSFYIDSETVY